MPGIYILADILAQLCPLKSLRLREGKCFAKGDPVHREPSSLGSLLTCVPRAAVRTWLLHKGEEVAVDFSSMPVFFVPHRRSRSQVRPIGPGDRNLQYRSLTS